MRQMRMLIIWFLCAGLTTLLNADTKRYDIKSGIIKYAITGNGNMMGVSMQTSGTATSIFRDWGSEELYEEQVSSVTMGQKTQEHEMSKLVDGKAYIVDFENKVILDYSGQVLTNSEYGDMLQKGKDTLIAMGGKKVGEEEFMGYDCEIWELAPAKIWIYKGVMLKSEASMMGVKYTTAAVEVDFDVSVSDSQLKLPDFPIKTISAGMIPSNQSTDEEEGDMPQLTPEQMLELQEAMKGFSKVQ
ncbi:MAG: hypothetical protein JXQ68_05850 [Campylobacterales bacterium]|nr:hypothetical protein [Campylobacterales bacterium]